MKLEFSRHIFEKYSDFKFTKNRILGAELFQANRRTERKTDVANPTVAFRNFVNTAKNQCKSQHTAMLENPVYATS